MVASIDGIYARTRPTKVISRLISYAVFEGRPLTTRGRWINPLVFFLFRMESILPQLKRVEKPVFILGTGRSGSTALGKVLSMHRDVGFLNEAKAIWHAAHPGEDLIGSYTDAPAQYFLTAEDATEEVRRTMHRIYGSYLALTFSKRIVEKYPELIFRVPFVRTLFPDAKFIFLVRNGLDTCSSVSSWSDRHGSADHEGTVDWWGKDRRKWQLLVKQVLPQHALLSKVQDEIKAVRLQTDMAAVEWILTMDQGLALLRETPGSVHTVRYEALTEKPRETLEHLADFCELRMDNKFIDYGARVLYPHTSDTAPALHESIQPAFAETMRALKYA